MAARRIYSGLPFSCIVYLCFYMKNNYRRELTGQELYIHRPLGIPTIFVLRPQGLEKPKGKNVQETWSKIGTTQE